MTRKLRLEIAQTDSPSMYLARWYEEDLKWPFYMIMVKESHVFEMFREFQLYCDLGNEEDRISVLARMDNLGVYVPGSIKGCIDASHPRRWGMDPWHLRTQ